LCATATTFISTTTTTIKGFAEKAKHWIERRDRELRKQEQRVKEDERRKAEADAKNEMKVPKERIGEDRLSRRHVTRWMDGCLKDKHLLPSPLLPSPHRGQVNYSFTEEDKQSALEKLTQAAARYEKHGPGSVGLEAFDEAEMAPHVFQRQLKNTFDIRVSGGGGGGGGGGV